LPTNLVLALKTSYSEENLKKLTTIALLTFAGMSLTAAPAPPEGLYLMTRYHGGSDLETRTYWFHNGTVVINPIASVKSLDVAAERARHPNDVGTYQLQAGQLTFTFPNSNRTARVEAIPGGFGWDAGVFSPVDVFKPGATLEGSFTGGASAGGGAVTRSTIITFMRDGTYVSKVVGGVSSQGRTTEVSAGSTRNERGKYRIDGTALHLTPDGGKETTYNTFPYDDHSPGPAPRGVYMGSTLMTRVK
jgi:hypothetical protein